jgi:hypothetical protein
VLKQLFSLYTFLSKKKKTPRDQKSFSGILRIRVYLDSDKYQTITNEQKENNFAE